MAQLPWAGDGITGAERQLLEEIAGLVVQDPDLAGKVLQYPWIATHHGAGPNALRSIEAIGAAAIEPELAWLLAGYAWLQDDVTSIEAEALDAIGGLALAAGPEYAGSLEELAGRSWLTDGVQSADLDGLDALLELLEAAGPQNSDILEDLVGYSWLTDGISDIERSALYHIRQLLRNPWATDSGIVKELVGYSWVADGIHSGERNDLGYFSKLLATVGAENSGPIATLLGYSWVSDGISSRDWYDLRYFTDLLESVEAGNAGLVETLVGYSWLADGIIGDERDHLRYVNELLHTSGVKQCGVGETLLGYPWLADHITSVEEDDLLDLISLLRNAGVTHCGGVEKLVAYSWLADGIAEVERDALRSLSQLLSTRGQIATTGAETLMGYSWLADGIDDHDLAFIAVLRAASDRSLEQYRDLLDSHHTRSKTISLPLAGDIKLLVFRHSPFPPDDDSIELMEDITGVLEEFMEVPFPRNPVVLSIIEPSLRAGEEPMWGVGYAPADQLAITGWEYNPGFDLAVFHEMSHVYWGGQTGASPWFTEGAAGFLPDYAREVLGVQTIEERRQELVDDLERDCLEKGIGNIRQLLELLGWNPDDERNRCNYHLGEFFLMETYRLLGRDATSAAMRELYLENEATGVDISERHIYQAFLSNAPQGKVEAFRELYGRIHGGEVASSAE